MRDSAGDEIYRLTQQSDGTWLWCDHLGQQGGDLIALVQDIMPGTSFPDAVFALSRGAARLQPQAPAPSPAPAEPLKLPTATRFQQADGRAYLNERGISTQTILHAEQSGMLRYVPGGVLFVGYDDQQRPRSATVRHIQDDAKPVKRDLRGSVKAFCPILPGNPSAVWIVEGGVDALAVQDAARSRGKTPPTVLVSGGAGVRSFLHQPAIHALLRQAQRIVIACDNEADRDIQARTDAQHQQQAERVREIAPTADTRLWHPPAAFKDIAEWHQQQAESSDIAPVLEARPGPTKTSASDRAHTPDGAPPSSTAGSDEQPA
ncbi:toprim domain-containing protein [Thiomonas intermedia]|uniref:toprim domain-containing protein n=1 Tax=Thiomonas intermedia TaxID=926 RepID=UPI0009A4AE43|nr:toprim domain-containing protein [Thiomonas intermedia]